MGKAGGTVKPDGQGLPRRTGGSVTQIASGLALVLVAGCGHRDVIDTPVSWWHDLEGGAIAQQRPPPPGVDDPYPKIGTTPAAAPQVASLDLRKSVTDNLVEQRNLSARLNAHDPLPPPVTAIAAPPKTPAPTAAASSATLDAADAPATPAPAPAQAAEPVTANPPGEAELAMPDVAPPATQPGAPAGTSVDAGSVAMPQIPSAPPPPPGLPGIGTPAEVTYAPPPQPHYALAARSGEALEFAAGSDVLSPGQSGTLQSVVARRGAGSIFVHGYGDAASDAPRDQAQALTLAALRARTVADVLEKQGVPSGSIHIRADAFGRGATAGLVD